MTPLIASAVALSLQLEGGAVGLNNPHDDDYVQYYNLKHEVNMASPVVGAALRLEPGAHFVATIGWRDMGHQRIEADLVSDPDYFKSLVTHHTPPVFYHWTTRMSLSEFYASAGYKFHVGEVNIVPTVGIADERMPTTIQFTYKQYVAYHWDTGDMRRTKPFFGVDVERGPCGIGFYLLQVNDRPVRQADPGQGASGVYMRVTYRWQP